jgi:asparagine synthase (glutamine-hydrolysing)
LNSMLFAWFHGSRLPSLLGSFDRVGMSHGIEVRLPFMDWRLVTFSFALPETSKIGAGFTKLALRLAMRGILPETIRLRTKKIGFVSPVEHWSRGTLKTWLLDVSASRTFQESAVWNGAAAREQIERAARGERSIDRVWPIINAYVLEQAFKNRARSTKGDDLATEGRRLQSF